MAEPEADLDRRRELTDELAKRVEDLRRLSEKLVDTVAELREETETP